MSNIHKHFPRLENLVHELQVFKASAIFEQAVGGQVGVAVGLAYILAQRCPQRRKLRKPASIGFNDELFWIFELGVVF